MGGRSFDRASGSGAVARALTLSVWLCGAAAGCGDDSGGTATSGDGCTTDVECKGDRICMGGACVDPTGSDTEADGGASGSGGAHADAGGDTDPSDAGMPSTAAGRGGSGGTGGLGGRPAVIDDPALEEACSLNCEARESAGCAMDTGSLDQCLGQCLIVDEINSGYCLDEQRVHYACLASGGYSCVSGYPQQKATCVAESIALAECNQQAPCRTFCAQAAGECAPAGDGCLTSCNETQGGFEDAICGIYYTQLLSCWNRNGACDGDRTAIEPCRAEISEVADCIASRTHECDGFCWAADQLGCGSSDCIASCKAKTEEVSCGSYYGRVIDCTVGSRELLLSCEAGAPTPDALRCESDITQWETCKQTM
jgi:hypothetical protein